MIRWHARAIAFVACLKALAAPLAAQDRLQQVAERAIESAWVEARALAAVGGAIEQTGPVGARLYDIQELVAVANRTPSVEGARLSLALRYGDAAVRAAISAAQDERDEMTVFLGQARRLDQQLVGLGSAALWPLPIDELEGELWLEADRYVESRDAYRRAVALRGSASAWLGLARANDRLGDRLAACDAYRRASAGPLADEDKAEAVSFVNSVACSLR